MEIRIRATRTLSITEAKVSAEEQEQLAQLYDDPRYKVLLNVMERICIETETKHFNTSVGQPEEILGGHALTKAAWLFFTQVQTQVQNAYHTRTRDEENVAEPSFEEQIQGVEGFSEAP